MSTYDPTVLPSGLPVPVDDGACDHLPGAMLPSVELESTDGGRVDLAQLARELTVLYCYPRTGLPGHAPPDAWDEIPGARGCTPQSLAFRDRHPDLTALGANVVGLSAQTTADQREFVERVALPFPLLSDPELKLADAMRLPTFEFEGERLMRRVTLILDRGLVERVFYPVFPPNLNAAEVAGWLSRRARETRRR